MSEAGRTIEGALTSSGLKVALIVSRFNGFITERLLEGAVDALVRTGASPGDLTVVRVPGAFELPGALRALVRKGGFDAVVCLGAVIRGATPHFDHVCAEAVKGIGSVAAEGKVAVGFGLLTTDTIEQAVERAGTKAGNKGAEAAMAAAEMAGLYRQLQ